MNVLRQKLFIWGVPGAAIIGVLLATIIRSGLFYQLNPDELAHAHVSYLLLHGYTPYTEFLMTYTPVFNWIIAPALIIRGYTLEAMETIRWVMVVAFLLRFLLAGIFVVRVFGKRIAALFVLLFLLDPFTVFTAMQVRPDNLMMLLYTAGLVALEHGLRSKRQRYIFLSGFLFASSGVVLLKIIPSLVVLWCFVVWYAKKVRSRFVFRSFTQGFLLPLLLFLTYTVATGSTTVMMQQVFMDAYAINKSIAFPEPLSNFYNVHNPFIYGVPGRPLWAFELSLPILAAVGLCVMMLERFMHRRTAGSSAIRFMQYVCAVSLIVQSGALLLVHSPFIQYFLPISWLFALFASVGIIQVLRRISPWKPLYVISIIGLSVIAWVLVLRSIKSNIGRSQSDNSISIWVPGIVKTWSRVPADKAVYPNMVFRPLAYPLAFGYYFHDLPRSIIRRLPPLVATLEQNKVPYMQRTYEWNALPPEFHMYVAAKYKPISKDLYIRR